MTVTLLATCLIGHGQNLVSNPSFEDHVGCPDGIGQVSKATGWVSVRNSPDYFNSCSPTFYFSVPANDGGFQYPPSPDCSAYMGLFTYPVTREYLGIQLSSPLTVGQRYFASFKVVLLDSQYTASNNIGMLFTTQLSPQGVQDTIKNFSQIKSNDLISDTMNWTTVFGSFIADSAYTSIQIGNFYDDSNTIVTKYSTSYYFVDDVCVSTDSLFCKNYLFVCNVGIQETQSVDVSLFPNPFSTQLTFSLADNEQITISLFNFLGQQVLRQTFTNSTTINTAQLADGIYFYALRSNKGTLKTGKLVKQ